MSFVGAMAVFMGYTFISLGGIARFGSWLVWENAIGANLGTVQHDRKLTELAIKKFFEHAWPPIAAIVPVVTLSRTSAPAAVGVSTATTIRTIGVGVGVIPALLAQRPC